LIDENVSYLEEEIVFIIIEEQLRKTRLTYLSPSEVLRMFGRITADVSFVLGSTTFCK
jgi:hypothetical protein